ncbi:MAG TPA: rRNA pseudouridine synthase [Desulfobacteraceae bacterium]|nr:rRNA pseudouridine synthase [Desulfobacteraceae bacterium]
MEERLQKILARAGVASRRKAEELILQGRIAVDGRVVTELGAKADPHAAKITIDGRPVAAEEKIYLLLNKPAGYVTTLADPQGRPIVTDLLTGIRQRVFPVGRLDYDTEGALILTNDGQLAHFILHPGYEVNKTYFAVVKGSPSEGNINLLREGIVLDGRQTWPALVRVVARKKGTTSLEITIHEGRKRQVRRMLSEIGYPVITLKRTAYGNLKLGSLPPGSYRLLTKKDLKKVFSGKIPFTFKKLPD